MRALRDDVAPRYVALGAGGDHEVEREDGDVDAPGGTMLVAFAPPAGWEAAFVGRQGYLGSRRYGGGEGVVVLVRWSSPLMYARALRDPAIGAAAEGVDAALYLPL